MLSHSVVSDSFCSPVDSSLPDFSVRGFPRQEYWSGLLLPIPGDLPNNGLKHASLASPALAGGFFTTTAIWKPLNNIREIKVLTFDCKELNSDSVQFSHLVVSDSLRPHESQHARPPVHHHLRSSLKLMSIESVMPSSHLILCRPLLLLPPSLQASESFPMSQLFA